VITMQEIYRGDPDTLISRTMEAVKTNQLRAEDVFAHYRQEYGKPFLALVSQYGQGNLFKAQRLTFGDWVAGKGYQDDLKAYYDAKATAWMAGTLHKDAWGAIVRFFEKRISPGFDFRKRMSEGPTASDFNQAWGMTNQREGWMWRDER
jgi:hypothetical protein